MVVEFSNRVVMFVEYWLFLAWVAVAPLHLKTSIKQISDLSIFCCCCCVEFFTAAKTDIQPSLLLINTVYMAACRLHLHVATNLIKQLNIARKNVL